MRLAQIKAIAKTTISEGWGSSDWYSVMERMVKDIARGLSVEEAAESAAETWGSDMGYDDLDDAKARIIDMYQLRKSRGYLPKIEESLLKEGYDERVAAAVRHKVKEGVLGSDYEYKREFPTSKFDYNAWKQGKGPKPERRAADKDDKKGPDPSRFLNKDGTLKLEAKKPTKAIPKMAFPGVKVTMLQSWQRKLDKGIKELGYDPEMSGYEDASTAWSVAFHIPKKFNIDEFEDKLREHFSFDGWMKVEFFDMEEK